MSIAANEATGSHQQNAVPHAPVPISQLALTSPRSESLLRRARVLWSISCRTLVSAYGHWRTRIASKSQTVAFGPAFRRLPDGSLQPEERTIARSSCIDNLLATHPWADVVDVQIFLAGFDAGEQWCLRNRDLDS